MLWAPGTGGSVTKPFMPLYVADYLGDTMDLTAEEHGAYLLLLMGLWRHHGRLPHDPDKLARIARVAPRRWGHVWGSIGRFFIVEGDQIRNSRVDQELKNAAQISEIRASAGRLGGKAKSLKNNETTVAKASVLPEQNRSSHSHSHNREEDTSLRSVSPPTRKIAPAVRPDDGFPADAFDRWYGAFPRHTARGAAEKAFAAMRRRGDVQFDALMDATKRFARSPPDPQFCPHPATWLNGKRYLDEPEPADLFVQRAPFAGNGGSRGRPPSGADVMLAATASFAARAEGRPMGDPWDTPDRGREIEHDPNEGSGGRRVVAR